MSAFEHAWIVLKQNISASQINQLSQQQLPLTDEDFAHFSHYDIADVYPPTEEGNRLINVRTNPGDLTFTNAKTGGLMRMKPPRQWRTSPIDRLIRESVPMYGPHMTPQMAEYYSRFLDKGEKE